MIRRVTLFALAMACSKPPPQIDFWVQQDGGSDSNDCSAAKPCLTIQGAISRIPRGKIDRPHVVHMSPGIFDGNVATGTVRGLTFEGKGALIIQGEQQPAWLDAGYRPLPDVDLPGIKMRGNYGAGDCTSGPVDGGWRLECL